VRAWLDPILADAPLEVTLVGDLDVEQTIALAARTLGKLSARRALREYADHKAPPTWKDGVSQEHAIDTEVQKSLVLLAFPVPDGIEIGRLRRFAFLAEVVRDRLRLEVRERLGAAYSPTAVLQASRVFPGTGMLLVQGTAEPGDAAALKAAFLSVTDALVEKGVTEEEVTRLREPMLNSLRDAQRQNGYWVFGLTEAQRRPASLDELRTQLSSIEALDAATLSALAKEYLGQKRVASLIVNPKAAAPAAAPAAEKPKEGG